MAWRLGPIEFQKVTVFLGLMAVLSCATSPEGRKQLNVVPDEQMEQMGAQAFAEILKQTPKVSESALHSYVTCVAEPILRVLPTAYAGKSWEIQVLESEQVNAFALPGRKIGVYKGLLSVATTPDQLAAVIGHEIGHVIAKHSNERVSEALLAQGGLAVLESILANRQLGYRKELMAALGVGFQFGVQLPHSRTQESEADIVGLRLMAQAGFDPRQATHLWQAMERKAGKNPPEFLSTHPLPQTRIKNISSKLPEVLPLYEQVSTKPNCIK